MIFASQQGRLLICTKSLLRCDLPTRRRISSYSSLLNRRPSQDFQQMRRITKITINNLRRSWVWIAHVDFRRQQGQKVKKDHSIARVTIKGIKSQLLPPMSPNFPSQSIATSIECALNDELSLACLRNLVRVGHNHKFNELYVQKLPCYYLS